MPLSEHVYCVVIAFKMTEWGEQQIYIAFCIELEHSSSKTIQMTQMAAVMGNWWLAASTRQHTHSCVTSHSEFFSKTSNHPDLVPCDFWLFPKLKSPLKGKRFQTIVKFRKIQWGSWWQLGELCEVPRCLLWRGQRRHCSMYTVSCILYLLQ